MKSSDLQGVGLTGIPADDPLAYSKVLLYYVVLFNLLVGQRRCIFLCETVTQNRMKGGLFYHVSPEIDG